MCRTYDERMDLTAGTRMVTRKVSRRTPLRRNVFRQKRTQRVCLMVQERCNANE